MIENDNMKEGSPTMYKSSYISKKIVNLRLPSLQKINLNSFKNTKTQLNIETRKDMTTQTTLSKTAVKFKFFPENFPEVKKNRFKNIKLKDIFSVLKFYKPEFKF